MRCKVGSYLCRVYERGWAIVIITAAAIVPPQLLDKTPAICPFRALTGCPCLGCGMTRAFVNVMHGKLSDAFEHNRLVVIVFPLIFLMSVIQFISLFRSSGDQKRLTKEGKRPSQQGVQQWQTNGTLLGSTRRNTGIGKQLDDSSSW